MPWRSPPKGYCWTNRIYVNFCRPPSRFTKPTHTTPFRRRAPSWKNFNEVNFVRPACSGSLRCAQRCSSRSSKNQPVPKDDADKSIGLIGFFEAHDNVEVARKMFSRAIDLLCEEGMGRQRYPAFRWRHAGILKLVRDNRLFVRLLYRRNFVIMVLYAILLHLARLPEP